MSNQFIIPQVMPIWAQSIGGFIINFGSSEFLAYRWILSIKGESAGLKLGKKPISDKIKIIKKSLPGHSISEGKKARVEKLFDEIASFVILRNRIAHNPLCFLPRESTGEMVLSPIDLKTMHPSKGGKVIGITHQEIAKAALRVNVINRELAAFLDA